MNEAARDALVNAAMRGVKQIKESLGDQDGGRCAIGVILEALVGTPDFFQYHPLMELAGLRTTMMPCPHDCGLDGDEKEMIVHMNDDHGDDFLTIARKLGDA